MPTSLLQQFLARGFVLFEIAIFRPAILYTEISRALRGKEIPDALYLREDV